MVGAERAGREPLPGRRSCYHDTLLEVIPTAEEGIAFGELAAAVASRVPDDVRAATSPGWWATTVKLDLEARGPIERIEGKGRQRLRKASG